MTSQASRRLAATSNAHHPAAPGPTPSSAAGHQLKNPIEAGIAAAGRPQAVALQKHRQLPGHRLALELIGKFDAGVGQYAGAGPITSISRGRNAGSATLIIFETAALSIPSAAMMISRP